MKQPQPSSPPKSAGKGSGKKLGQLLVGKGWVTGEQLIRAIQSQRAVGGRVGTCLLEMDVVTEEHLLDVLSEQLEVPAVRIEQLRYIPEHILDLIPAKVAQRCLAIPFGLEENEVFVATLNVHNLAILDELAFCTNKTVRPFIANEVRIFEALEKYYRFEIPPRYGHLLDRLNRARYLWDGEAAENLRVGETHFEFDSVDEDAIWSDPEETLLMGEAVRLNPDGAGDAPAAESPVEAEDPIAEVPTAEIANAEPPSEREKNSLATAETKPIDPPVPDPNEDTIKIAILTEEAQTATSLGISEDLKELFRKLEEAPSSSAVGKLLLAHLETRCARSAIFQVRQECVTGWLARGEGFDPKLFRAVLVPFNQPSIFLNLLRGAEFHLGPLPQMDTHRQIVRCWGGEWPEQCLFMPITLRDRMVIVLYCDFGGAAPEDLSIDTFRTLAGKASDALELCILRKKLQS